MKTYLCAALCLMVSLPCFADEDGFEVEGINKTAEHACKDGEAITINGIGHKVTLTGPCGSIEVSGQQHVVTTEVVDSVSITGQQNSVTWKSARDPKKKVKKSVTGLKNKAGQAK